MPLGTEVGVGSGDIVLDGDTAPPSKKISLCLLWGNDWMDQGATWYGGRPRPRPQCVRWGPSSPQKGHCSPHPTFQPVCCGQTVGWIKMPLGTEVGLGTGHILECRSEMYCTQLAENPTRKKSPENSHLRTIAQLDCIFATRECIDNRKKLVK